MSRKKQIVRACVFTTGAVTIALELIASRILTPYVGGSLYVWTAILSITLLALAVGYHLGGKWSHLPRRDRLFVRFPAATAIILCVVALAYPYILPGIAYRDALAGAFLGSLLVLGPTLVLLSAMGPIGIAMTATPKGDRGAGAMFAIGTVGSVVGALVAAFVLLPFMSPPGTLVVLAGGLVGVSVAAQLLVRDRVTVAGLLPASVLVIGGVGLLTLNAPPTVDLGDVSARHVATARGPYASAIVVDVVHDTRPGRVRLYLEENQIQSARSEGMPGEPLRYVSMVKEVFENVVPNDGRVLVLGLAGGTIASDLAEAGHAVEAVEINPDAVDVAERWFGFDAAAVPVATEDARRFLDRCRVGYDAILFDTFSGITVPDHLVTVQAFGAAQRCLAQNGVVIANTIVPSLDSRPTLRLMAALSEGVGDDVVLYSDPAVRSPVKNRIMVAGLGGREPPVLRIPYYPTEMFERHPVTIEPVIVNQAVLESVEPLSDYANDFALTTARAGMNMTFFPIPASWH